MWLWCPLETDDCLSIKGQLFANFFTRLEKSWPEVASNKISWPDPTWPDPRCDKQKDEWFLKKKYPTQLTEFGKNLYQILTNPKRPESRSDSSAYLGWPGSIRQVACEQISFPASGLNSFIL